MVISLALAFLVIAGSFIIYVAYFQPEELQKPPQQDLQPIPQQSPVYSSSTRPPLYDYCIIQEVHPDFLKVIPDFVDPNATIVHLSSDDLKPFPEYQKRMADENKLSEKWLDGHRMISNFRDYQRQFSDFRNLTCKYNPNPKCNPWKSSQVYEYNGRDFLVGCLPDFGGEHQNLPPQR
jgi:hypothetical protein